LQGGTITHRRNKETKSFASFVRSMDLSALESISKALEKSLDFWGLLLLLSTAVVVFGLVVEYWHDVEEFWLIAHWPMAAFPWDKFKTLVGGILVTIGVAGELIVTYKASRVETQLRENSHRIEAFLTQQAGDAVQSAKMAHAEADAVKGMADEARADAKDALAKAQAAQRELAHAEADAAKAQAAAAKALSTADKAESHLTEVVKRANELTEQLKRVTTPRSLPDSAQVVTSLKPFKGTEYMFTGVCGDAECIKLLRDIEKVLGLAEWKRVKAPHKFPGFVLWGKREDDDGAGFDFEPGVKVSADIARPEMANLSESQLPQYLRAAIALNATLRSSISPPENTGKLIDVTNGSSTTVRISVGRKPLP
jgi:multidrug efflux pump subunit AcrA (membrane-fusion protein)